MSFVRTGAVARRPCGSAALWSGLNEHARHNARRLAEAGYVALALDRAEAFS